MYSPNFFCYFYVTKSPCPGLIIESEVNTKVDDFQKIYETYFLDVYRYLLTLCKDTHIAEEITQETFFKALKKIDSFDGKCTLFVWLCQIAKNTYFTHYEKHKKLTVYHPDTEAASTESLMDSIITKESAFEIHKILHNLEEPYKEVFSLRTFGELSFKQIGELFEKTESWARVTYYRAKVKIKEELE